MLPASTSVPLPFSSLTRSHRPDPLPRSRSPRFPRENLHRPADNRGKSPVPADLRGLRRGHHVLGDGDVREFTAFLRVGVGVTAPSPQRAVLRRADNHGEGGGRGVRLRIAAARRDGGLRGSERGVSDRRGGEGRRGGRAADEGGKIEADRAVHAGEPGARAFDGESADRRPREHESSISPAAAEDSWKPWNPGERSDHSREDEAGAVYEERGLGVEPRGECEIGTSRRVRRVRTRESRGCR